MLSPDTKAALEYLAVALDDADIDVGDISCKIASLARAVAREEIERASDRQQDRPPSDTRTTPGGVRVVWRNDKGVDFADEMRLEVDREALVSVLEQWADDDNMTLGEVAARLGLTFSDRG